MTEEEGREWEEKMRRLGVEPFLTADVDLESHFLDISHLDAVNDERSESDFENLIQSARALARDESVAKYVNGRIVVERAKGTHASIDHGKLAVEAAKAVEDDPIGKSHGKTVLKRLRAEFRALYGTELQVTLPSEHIAARELQTIANKTFRK
jgi:hypothetical protein